MVKKIYDKEDWWKFLNKLELEYTENIYFPKISIWRTMKKFKKNPIKYEKTNNCSEKI